MFLQVGGSVASNAGYNQEGGNASTRNNNFAPNLKSRMTFPPRGPKHLQVAGMEPFIDQRVPRGPKGMKSGEKSNCNRMNKQQWGDVWAL
jgi:hypothetical protein